MGMLVPPLEQSMGPGDPGARHSPQQPVGGQGSVTGWAQRVMLETNQAHCKEMRRQKAAQGLLLAGPWPRTERVNPAGSGDATLPAHRLPLPRPPAAQRRAEWGISLAGAETS